MPDELPPEVEEQPDPCPICGRPIVPGPSANRHHWKPKTKGGKDWTWLHMICHRKIHAEYTEAQLARDFDSAEKLLADPEIQRFVAWVRKKDPEFYDPTVTAKAKGGRMPGKNR